MVKVIKAGTKKAETLLAGANIYQGRTLFDVYGRVSQDKIKAYNDCAYECVQDGGENFRITSHNTYSFSLAWEFQYMNPETGELIPATRIKTSKSNYVVLHEK